MLLRSTYIIQRKILYQQNHRWINIYFLLLGCHSVWKYCTNRNIGREYHHILLYLLHLRFDSPLMKNMSLTSIYRSILFEVYIFYEVFSDLWSDPSSLSPYIIKVSTIQMSPLIFTTNEDLHIIFILRSISNFYMVFIPSLFSPCHLATSSIFYSLSILHFASCNQPISDKQIDLSYLITQRLSNRLDKLTCMIVGLIWLKLISCMPSHIQGYFLYYSKHLE